VTLVGTADWLLVALVLLALLVLFEVVLVVPVAVPVSSPRMLRPVNRTLLASVLSVTLGEYENRTRSFS
jgi:hypothetical protein